ncbi:MAG: hypothetical protein R3A52_00810 [Polyangiales bacterium]
MQSTQTPAEVSQTCPGQVRDEVQATVATHAPRWQAKPVGQSAEAVHATHAPVARSQRGVGAEQSAADVQRAPPGVIRGRR